MSETAYFNHSEDPTGDIFDAKAMIAALGDLLSGYDPENSHIPPKHVTRGLAGLLNLVADEVENIERDLLEIDHAQGGGPVDTGDVEESLLQAVRKRHENGGKTKAELREALTQVKRLIDQIFETTDNSIFPEPKEGGD
ncbi:MAG: hypothetical protein SWQ30_10085 [Thermodesulfobacteriota bacterium]|nr:hypothetical protein [Thermodesulfobacteriota bacterium]